ncbi:MAG: hypothetical protein QM758_06590 [Armatimonas sp.]
MQQQTASMYQVITAEGQRLAPVTLAALQEMASIGILFSDSLVFDMAQNRNIRADSIADLRSMLRHNPSGFGDAPTAPSYNSPPMAAPPAQATTYCSGCGKLSTGTSCTGCGKDLRAPQQQQLQQPQQPVYSAPQPQQQQYSAPTRQQSDVAPRQTVGMISKPQGYSASGAIIGSVFVVGLGQMINGQTAKGVVLLIAALVIGLPTALLGSFVLGVLGIIDAVMIGKRLERGESVGEWQFF